MSDNSTNTASARHHVAQLRQHHEAIVKLQEERDILRAQVRELEALLDAERVLRWTA